MVLRKQLKHKETQSIVSKKVVFCKYIIADDKTIPIYNKYYKRYAARLNVRQIKEADFKHWKYEAMPKRDK